MLVNNFNNKTMTIFLNYTFDNSSRDDDSTKLPLTVQVNRNFTNKEFSPNFIFKTKEKEFASIDTHKHSLKFLISYK